MSVENPPDRYTMISDEEEIERTVPVVEALKERVLIFQSPLILIRVKWQKQISKPEWI